MKVSESLKKIKSESKKKNDYSKLLKEYQKLEKEGVIIKKGYDFGQIETIGGKANKSEKGQSNDISIEMNQFNFLSIS
ncbi:MAG: hypothetical protein PHR61_02125 [Candidatus Absconditabacteria bacterium]|nr:hypothetical protein [Candidatus Absconditabacteria bacterium]